MSLAYQVAVLPPAATVLANKFYRQHGGRGRANKQETIWTVKQAHQLCAVARVQSSLANQQCEQEKEYNFLCGVLVAPKWRGQGVARTLIGQLTQAQSVPLYSFVYRHLAPFYQQLGFTACDELPVQLNTRFSSYQKQGRDILAYCYQL